MVVAKILNGKSLLSWGRVKIWSAFCFGRLHSNTCEHFLCASTNAVFKLLDKEKARANTSRFSMVTVSRTKQLFGQRNIGATVSNSRSARADQRTDELGNDKDK